jgi:hypothetical protein
MVKNDALKKLNEVDEDDEDFDYSDMTDSSYDDREGMANVLMSGLIESSNNQMMLAMELTRLALEKNPSKEMKEDAVFSVFKEASAVIAESFPLKSLLANFAEEH